jgi:phosphate:Na+ symporter
MMTQTLTLLVSGLSLFLFALQGLAELLKTFAGSKLNRFLHRASINRVRGVITGTVVTTLMDSSSAVIIILLALVKSGWLSALASYSIILGANIGTTLSSQIIALKLANYLILALPLGLFLGFFSKKDRSTRAAKVLSYLGLVFLGLHLIDLAVEPFKHDEALRGVLLGLNNPIYAAFTGMVVTLVIQSSSATVALGITLVGSGLLSTDAGIGIMLGAELGTCSDTLLACLGKNRTALKVGAFHFLFNLGTIFIALALFSKFTAVVRWLSPTAEGGQLVANAHFLFNGLGVLLVLPFLRPIDRVIGGVIDRIIGQLPEGSFKTALEADYVPVS